MKRQTIHITSQRYISDPAFCGDLLAYALQDGIEVVNFQEERSVFHFEYPYIGRSLSFPYFGNGNSACVSDLSSPLLNETSVTFGCIRRDAWKSAQTAVTGLTFGGEVQLQLTIDGFLGKKIFELGDEIYIVGCCDGDDNDYMMHISRDGRIGWKLCVGKVIQRLVCTGNKPFLLVSMIHNEVCVLQVFPCGKLVEILRLPRHLSNGLIPRMELRRAFSGLIYLVINMIEVGRVIVWTEAPDGTLTLVSDLSISSGEGKVLWCDVTIEDTGKKLAVEKSIITDRGLLDIVSWSPLAEPFAERIIYQSNMGDRAPLSFSGLPILFAQNGVVCSFWEDSAKHTNQILIDAEFEEMQFRNVLTWQVHNKQIFVLSALENGVRMDLLSI